MHACVCEAAALPLPVFQASLPCRRWSCALTWSTARPGPGGPAGVGKKGEEDEGVDRGSEGAGIGEARWSFLGGCSHTANSSPACVAKRLKAFWWALPSSRRPVTPCRHPVMFTHRSCLAAVRQHSERNHAAALTQSAPRSRSLTRTRSSRIFPQSAIGGTRGPLAQGVVVPFGDGARFSAPHNVWFWFHLGLWRFT